MYNKSLLITKAVIVLLLPSIITTLSYHSSLNILPAQRKRVGRGVGSGTGKTSSHGHQFSRSTPRQFEGGQTAFWKRMPKSGFHNIK